MQARTGPLDDALAPGDSFKASSGQKQDDNVAATLIDLSASMCAAYGTDAALELNRTYCSKDFIFLTADQHENALPSDGNFEDQIADTALIRKANPYWHAGAFNFSASVNAECGLGTVWYTVRGTGISDGTKPILRESVIKLDWRKRDSDQKWELYRNQAIYGPGNFFVMDDAKEWVDIGV